MYKFNLAAENDLFLQPAVFSTLIMSLFILYIIHITSVKAAHFDIAEHLKTVVPHLG